MGIEILDERNSVGFAPFDWVSDATDSVKDAVDDVWDALDDIPGFKQLGEGTKSLFTGPLRDFAKTAVGQTVLRAMTGVAMGLTGGIAGPWAMMATAALPGVIAGSPFEEALITENLYRATEAVKILTANQVKVPGIEFPIPPEVQKIVTQSLDVLNELKRRAAEMGLPIEEAVRKLAADYGVPDNLEALGVKLANEMGVREDFAVQAIEMAAKQKLLSHENYDMATGKKTVSSFGRFTPLSPAAAALRGASLVSKAVQNPTLTQAAAKSPTAQALKGATLMSKVAPSRTVTILSSVAKKTPPIMMSVVKPLASVTPQGRPESVSTLRQAVTVEQEPSFWEEHKTKLLVGGGAVAIVGLYFWWSKR